MTKLILHFYTDSTRAFAALKAFASATPGAVANRGTHDVITREGKERHLFRATLNDLEGLEFSRIEFASGVPEATQKLLLTRLRK